MNTKHAVISDNYICWLDGERAAYIDTISSIADAWEVGQKHSITHFWIMPGSEVDRMDVRFFDAGPEYSVFVSSTSEMKPKFGRICKAKGPRQNVYIGYPHRGRFNWEVKDPVDILNTVEYLEMQLGVPCEWSPGHMGDEMLKKVWAKKPTVIRDTTEDLRDLPFSEAAYAITFRRSLTPSMIGQWCHHYDKRSDFLAACRSTKTGIGDPVHLMDGDDNQPIVPGLPGIYRVSWIIGDVGDATFNGVLLPTIIDERQEWVTNDVLDFAIRKGYEVRIHEAYVWDGKDSSAKILDELALAIWTARKNFKDSNPFFPNETARKNAYATAKEIALIVVGSFNTNKLARPSNKGIHPNWWADVVGKARVAELANLEKYSAVAGAPVCIEADSLFFVTRDPNYRTAVPGILDRQDELGGYRHLGTCQITQEMYERSEAMNYGELAAMLKQAGGEE